MKRRPAIGTRVMRVYGRKEYAEYGEIGTVTAHEGSGSFEMTLDGRQPYARSMWGAKAKPTDNGGLVHQHLSASEVEPLVSVYRNNARRLRDVAKVWSDAAKREAGAP